jgi:hypothetical protein
LAYDMRLMMRRYQQKAATPADLDRLTTLLGRPPTLVSGFRLGTAKHWRAKAIIEESESPSSRRPGSFIS